MRLVRHFGFWAVCLALGMVLATAQAPIGIGPSLGGNLGAGVVKFFDWYSATPAGGCTNGSNGYCVGVGIAGDTNYWTAWLPNASGLPKTGGLPIVGTLNDASFGTVCSGNIIVLQLDKFDWSAPASSHAEKVNCMSDFGTAPGASNSPSGWNGHLTSTDSVGNAGTWKSRSPFSKGGVLYLPVERQISAGGPSVHDATYIMSPDSGAHWCNPYTYFSHAGSPGCDSSNWSATGAAPLCAASSSSTPCTDPGYLDSTHSSVMWKGLPLGTENWNWINYGNQDGQTLPSGVNDGCDPATYTCFMMLGEGSLARVPNGSIMDISAWQYYTCPTMTQNYRCPGSDPANWTSTFANRTKTLYLTWYQDTFQARFRTLYTVTYVKEFKSYIMSGITYNGGHLINLAWAPTVQGPWNTMYIGPATNPDGAFFSFAPALGYTVVSTDPPHVQLGASGNGYGVASGTPQMSVWDLVLGRQDHGGTAFTSMNLGKYVAGAGYQFSVGNFAGTLPARGMVWSIDYLDAGVNSGVTNWPFFVERGNNSAAIVPCEGTYTSFYSCGGMNAGHGTSMNDYGIKVTDSNESYGGHYRTFAAESVPYTAAYQANAPSAMQGNGSYSVVGVYRYEGVTPFHRSGGIWSTGVPSNSDNTMVELTQVDGKLELDWNATYKPRYLYAVNFTFPNFTNWYFIAVTVQAQTGCGTNCTPAAKVWVGGAVTPGVLADANAGVAYQAVNSPTTKTPNVSAGPFVIGLNGHNDSMTGTTATTIIYDRALSYPEVQLMYRTLRSKMLQRGVTLQ